MAEIVSSSIRNCSEAITERGRKCRKQESWYPAQGKINNQSERYQPSDEKNPAQTYNKPNLKTVCWYGNHEQQGLEKEKIRVER